jgi:hypothetical protein
MRLEKRSAGMMLLATACVMTSACGQPERPQTVSDFCLADKRISAEPAPGPSVDDPGNQFDTDATLNEILAHNEVHDRLCPPAP